MPQILFYFYFLFFRPIKTRCDVPENFDMKRLLEKTAKMPLVSKQAGWERKKECFQMVGTYGSLPLVWMFPRIAPAAVKDFDIR